MKRHSRIAHETNDPPNAGGLISPNSQPDKDVIDQRNDLRAAENPAAIQPAAAAAPYDAPPAPRANVPLPVTSAAVEQWTGPQHGTYMQPPQPIITPDSHAALGGHAGVTHDADILEAAQLLLPGGYRDPQPPGSVTFYWDFLN